MTELTISRCSYIMHCTLVILVLAGCAGAHAAKVHARTVKPIQSSVRSDSASHQIPPGAEPKPLVGELMA